MVLFGVEVIGRDLDIVLEAALEEISMTGSALTKTALCKFVGKDVGGDRIG